MVWILVGCIEAEEKILCNTRALALKGGTIKENRFNPYINFRHFSSP
jgi:hypothetical protein